MRPPSWLTTDLDSRLSSCGCRLLPRAKRPGGWWPVVINPRETRMPLRPIDKSADEHGDRNEVEKDRQQILDQVALGRWPAFPPATHRLLVRLPSCPPGCSRPPRSPSRRKPPRRTTTPLRWPSATRERRRLRGEPQEPLDDVIVKISCDAIPIGQDDELPTSATEFSQLRAPFRGHNTRSALTRGESPGPVRSSPL